MKTVMMIDSLDADAIFFGILIVAAFGWMMYRLVTATPKSDWSYEDDQNIEEEILNEIERD